MEIILFFLLIMEFDGQVVAKSMTKKIKDEGEMETKSKKMDNKVSTTTEDSRNDAAIKTNTSETTRSLMYAEDKFEGDIMKETGMRSATSNETRLWPQGTIPFEISTNYSVTQRGVIAKGMDFFHTKTCVRFVPKKPDDKAYISIEPLRGCWSYVGRIGTRQSLSLEKPGCMKMGTVLHELMHSLGFHHEQSRPDRDQYVKFFPQNVKPRIHDAFGKLNKHEMKLLGEKYDAFSVLHYDSFAFSKNSSSPTLLLKNGKKIPPAKTANRNDIRKINKLYNCTQKTTTVKHQ